MAKPYIKSCPTLEYIYSIAHNQKQSNYLPHRHSFWELILFERGEGIHTINGENYPFRRGGVALLSPTDIHYITNTPGTTRDCIKVKFSYNIWHDHLRQVCSFSGFPVVATLEEPDLTYAFQIMNMLFNEHSKQVQPDNTEFSINLIASLIMLIQRNLPNQSKTDNSKTRNILLYLQEHFCEPITIADVATSFNYSPKYFSRLFVNSIGVPFHEYLNDLRLNYAYHLIKYSELPITEVCFNVGFTSPSHFSKSFKQKYDISPSYLRNHSAIKKQ